jgi:hypothetical protein
VKKLAAAVAALVCALALALSAGAALAEHHAAPTKKGAPKAPSFYCPLHEL